MAPAVILLSHGFAVEYECAFANALARNGVAVTLIASDETLLRRLEPAVRVLNYRGSQDPKRTRADKASTVLGYIARYFLLLLRTRGQPVHMIGMFTTSNLWVSLVEAWCTRWLAGRYAMTVHNLMPHDRHTRRNRWLMRGIYRSAAVCMVHTQKMGSALHSDFGVPLQRIMVVEHGIDRLLLQQPGQPRQALRRRLALPESGPVVLFFGAVAPYKGLDVLLPAMDIVRQTCPAVLVVAGRCRDAALMAWMKTEMGARVAAGAAFWFDGYWPDDEMPLIFQAADLVVMPYRYIDQSGVVFMALATGVPVVASDVGSLAAYIEPPGCTVTPGAVHELAAAIVRVLAAPRPAPDVAQVSAERHLWSRTVVPMIGAYRQVWPGWGG